MPGQQRSLLGLRRGCSQHPRLTALRLVGRDPHSATGDGPLEGMLPTSLTPNREYCQMEERIFNPLGRLATRQAHMGEFSHCPPNSSSRPPLVPPVPSTPHTVSERRRLLGSTTGALLASVPGSSTHTPSRTRHRWHVLHRYLPAALPKHLRLHFQHEEEEGVLGLLLGRHLRKISSVLPRTEKLFARDGHVIK